MKKMTAIEWLLDSLNKNNISPDSICERIKMESKIIQQAMEMEKNQSSICTDKEIIQAKIDGAIMAHTVGYKAAIEYYKNLKNNL